MTDSAQVYSGDLTRLQVGDELATAVLNHTMNGKAYAIPVRIDQEALTLLGIVVEGPVKLFGQIIGGCLHVTGPAESYLISGEILDVNSHVCELTGTTVLKGEIRFEEDDTVRDFIVRNPEWIELLHESYEPFGLNMVDFVAVMRGDIFEVTQLPDQDEVEAIRNQNKEVSDLAAVTIQDERLREIWDSATAEVLH